MHMARLMNSVTHAKPVSTVLLNSETEQKYFHLMQLLDNSEAFMHRPCHWCSESFTGTITRNIQIQTQISMSTIYFSTQLGLYSSSRRLTTKSREVLKLQDSGLYFSNRSEMMRAPLQQRCPDACKISERWEHYVTQSRGFETWRDLAVRCLTVYGTIARIPEWDSSDYCNLCGTLAFFKHQENVVIIQNMVIRFIRK